jgi:transcriptional regulator with XRE-family HTH domain
VLRCLPVSVPRLTLAGSLPPCVVNSLRREQVAQRAAISVDLLQSLEQGRMANPSARTILGLARALGVPYTELMDCLALDLQEERRRQLATEKEKELDLLIAGAAAGEAADSGS